ncbi:S8 family serine peptidase [Chondrinema litorale]|uniref:S8 family serine peptidase n=1 Tax=Chondrinema litorale TaxID=2994555 RepID=UPI002543CE65|nr:S8 family serine peptidase [Chondrinema litorale]UZR94967.1 S8 family serine peptidase [Chondrinema litorale]
MHQPFFLLTTLKKIFFTDKRAVLCCLLFLLTFSSNLSFAQSKAVFFFNDKVGSAFTISDAEEFLTERAILRREKQGISLNERDLPVSSVYLDSMVEAGATVLYTTKWLNGVLVEVDDEAVFETIQNFTFIKESNINLGTLSISSFSSTEEKHISTANKKLETDLDYGNSYNQLEMLGVPTMHAMGYKGEGMLIAVLDGGFNNADEITVFDSLFINDQILNTYDFVEREENVYDDHNHGTQVLSTMAGNTPGSLIGSAYKADYVLLRSEDVSNESRLEEFYWLVAAEYADSIGADIINSSVGYNIFDDELDNYTQDDLDGETAFITIAADFAASTGMFIVSSAGNEGNDPWGSITPPADGDSVLAVGAVNSVQSYAAFSSVGPSADGRIKPDVTAQGSSTVVGSGSGNITSSNGTSFSAPIIAGLAAGIWQARPELTNMQLLDTIKSISSQYENPDNELGYGVPDFRRLSTVLSASDQINSFEFQMYPIPFATSLQIALPTELIGNDVEVRIYDLMGKILFKKNTTVTDNYLILKESELINISKGMMILGVSGNVGSAYRKVIKN